MRFKSERPTYTIRVLICYVASWAIATAVYVPFARRLDLPWWSIFAVAAGGGLVGVLSGHRGRLRSLSTGLWASVLAVVAIPVLGLAGLLLLGRITFSSNFELRDVSYARYQRHIDVLDMNPRGAKDISFSEKSRKDYRICFWMMFIGTDDYQQLLDGRRRTLSADSPNCFLQKTEIGSLTMNEFTANAPDWWRLPQRDAQLSVHALQCDDGRGIKTYLRGVWVYDDLSSTLWIVEK